MVSLDIMCFFITIGHTLKLLKKQLKLKATILFNLKQVKIFPRTISKLLL